MKELPCARCYETGSYFTVYDELLLFHSDCRGAGQILLIEQGALFRRKGGQPARAAVATKLQKSGSPTAAYESADSATTT